MGGKGRFGEYRICHDGAKGNGKLLPFCVNVDGADAIAHKCYLLPK